MFEVPVHHRSTVLICLWAVVFLCAGYVGFQAASHIVNHENTPDASPINIVTHKDHEWVTFGNGGLYHNPDCPCKGNK